METGQLQEEQEEESVGFVMQDIASLEGRRGGRRGKGRRWQPDPDVEQEDAWEEVEFFDLGVSNQFANLEEEGNRSGEDSGNEEDMAEGLAEELDVLNFIGTLEEEDLPGQHHGPGGEQQ